MTAPVAELRDVQVLYDDRLVLDMPYLALEPGRTLTVIGPNGSGKSTLLRVLALLERPTHGDLLVDGKRLGNGADVLHYRRRLALAMQQPFLRRTSVWENVATGLRFRRVPRDETRRRVDDWLDRLGVSHLARQDARTLSGGEARRVSLARALVLEPDILLLDEAFAGLDTPTRLSLIEDLQRILGRVDVSTVFVTHDRTEAQIMGDRLAVIIEGRLRQIGRPEDVFADPAGEQVAAFVGVDNIVRGRVAHSGGGAATALVGGVPISVVGDFARGDELVVGIRPEAVILEPVSRDSVLTSALNRLPGEVTGILHMGALARVTVDCGLPLVSLVTGQSVENLSLAPGTAVLASFKASAIQVIRHIPGDATGPPA